ncbi:MAG: hypothetical protein IKM53_03855 [Clostridia bacterium]|nr:hypothetical protein [Clostridia bacterium]
MKSTKGRFLEFTVALLTALSIFVLLLAAAFLYYPELVYAYDFITALNS